MVLRVEQKQFTNNFLATMKCSAIFENSAHKKIVKYIATLMFLKGHKTHANMIM